MYKSKLLFFLFISVLLFLFHCKSTPVLQGKTSDGYSKYKVRLSSFENKDDARKRLIKFLGCKKADVKDEDFKIEVIVDNNYPGGMSNTIKKRYYFSTLKCKEEPKKKVVAIKKPIAKKKEVLSKKEKPVEKKEIAPAKVLEKKEIAPAKVLEKKEEKVVEKKKTSDKKYPSFEEIAGKEERNPKELNLIRKPKKTTPVKKKKTIQSKKTSAIVSSQYNKPCVTDYCKKKRIPDELNDSAIALAKQGNIYQAIEQFEKASALQDKHVAKTYNNMGYAYELAGKTNKAITAYKKAIRRDPKLITALQHLVRLYYLKGMKSTARRYKQRVLEIDPHNSFVEKYK